MNKVLDIKKLKNNTYLVTFDVAGKTKTQVLSEETLISFNLLSLKDISKEDYKKLIKQNDDNMLYNKAIHFIDYQMRSISEVKKHLKKSTKDDTKINSIIKKLKDQQYLNDNHFASEYVTQKIEFDLVGPKYIKEKLIQKGIHYDLIDGNLVRFTEDMMFDKISELIKKETKYPIKKPYKKAYISIKTKLIGKGFPLRIVEASLGSYGDIIKDSCLEDDLIEKEVNTLKKRYDISDYKEKEKVVGKLLQKGFDYSLIKKHLS